MASMKKDKKGDDEFYEYEREYEKQDGTIGTIKQRVPKKKVIRRELIEKSKDNGKYIYKYKTYFEDGESKIITMTRKYKSKKGDKN